MGDYGSIRLIFDVTTLPLNFNTTEWMIMLTTSISELISKTYSIRVNQIEIESIQLVMNETLTSMSPIHQSQHKNKELHLLYVDINILPSSAEPEVIHVVKNVS